jgi:hypothetical protein
MRGEVRSFKVVETIPSHQYLKHVENISGAMDITISRI